MTDYSISARSRWPKANIYGSGRWAILSCGGAVEVSLRSSRESAMELKAVLDRDGCGRRCRGAHEIFDLGQESSSASASPRA
jgi:hypothetical protein